MAEILADGLIREWNITLKWEKARSYMSVKKQPKV